MNTFLLLAAIFNTVFAVFHLFFWKLFRWKQELPKLSFINRNIMQILNIRMTYLFFTLALLMFVFPEEIQTTQLGKMLILVMAGFWLMRAAEQVVFFGVKNKLSNVFVVIFLVGSIFHIKAFLAAS